MAKEIYEVWKEEKEVKKYQWKLQMPKGILSFYKKRDAVEMARVLKEAEYDGESKLPLEEPKPKLTMADLVEFRAGYVKERHDFTERLVHALENVTVETFGTTTDYLNLLNGRIQMIDILLKNYEV